MPKADPSKDYYGILDLKSDANSDDIKRAYHKLALKWHPDRNHGRELEASTKFQDISAAYEILVEPSTRAKYDNDRAKLFPKYSTYTSPTTATNPFANFPGTTRSPRAPKPPPNAAPGPNMKSPTAQYAQYTANRSAWANTKEGVRTQADATHAYDAWTSMKGGPAPGRVPVPPMSGRGVPQPPTRGVPTMPPRKPPRPQTFAHPASTTATQSTPRARAGWNESDTFPGPGMARANTMRTPKKSGFDPGSNAGDEPPARSTAAYTHLSREDAFASSRPSNHAQPPRPQPQAPRPDSQKPNPFKGFRSPRSEENINDRLSTPYATGGGERTYFSSEGLYRNLSSESASNMQNGWDGHEAQQRSPRSARSPGTAERYRGLHRSASPRMRASSTVDLSSSSGDSSDEDIASRAKLRPRGFNQRHTYASKVSDQQKSPAQPTQPSVTVENEDGHVFEFSKPMKRSTWNSEVTNGKSQADRTAAEEAAARRTSTGDIHESASRQTSRDPNHPIPSPLHNSTSLNVDSSFPPLEKSPSWQEQYGSPKDTSAQRHFDPPADGGSGHNFAPSNHSSDSTSSPKDQGVERNGNQFSTQEWARRFSTVTANPFHPQNMNTEYARRGSPMKNRGYGGLRTPHKSNVGVKRPNFAQSANASAASSTSDEEPSQTTASSASKSADSLSSGNAMDIDSRTPPATAETAFINDPLATRVHSQAPRTQASGPDPDAHLNMNDFQKTAPFAPSNGGLSDLGDLHSTLPFESRAASTLPTGEVHPHRLALPGPPKAPKPPNLHALKKSDWEYYVAFMQKYITEWNIFNKRMLSHYNARQDSIENDLPSHWIDGQGEIGYLKYMAWLEEDIRVRAHWDVSYEKHLEALKTLGEIRRVAYGGKFVG